MDYLFAFLVFHLLKQLLIIYVNVILLLQMSKTLLKFDSLNILTVKLQ